MDKELKFSDFLGYEVLRDNGVAELIVDYVGDKPVRLIGFYRDLSLSDIRVREEAYYYYQELVAKVNKN